MIPLNDAVIAATLDTVATNESAVLDPINSPEGQAALGCIK